MSKEQLKAFLEQVKAETSLQEKLKAAADADAVLIRQKAGFMISADDSMKAGSASDKDLESAAGGRCMVCLTTKCLTNPTDDEHQFSRDIG
ncbi:Nif11-like leader peptide family RiPP precursor [Synechococcus sp. MIT S9509]|uniref:Nif11-like leader peptide family RiPP precursor n=1 Tax=Synechococcus sp. MIT S9509 TaxID=1801630 RepID=UPI0009EE860C|nr:Nif11-like leader peptide family RiPP precursor [Synechococcus sp. MIT S9509]